jgi:peptidoglycan/LPS O-acetylase OafA/YrhL
MDIVFLALTLVAALLLPRSRAWLATVAAWAVCLAFVGWGPASNSDVHTDSVAFWGPWLVVLLIGLGLVALVDAVRRRRRAARS